jgi:glyoxylase-like metal-dependent hydrolase (beta-lactamase superfamily II)
MADLREIHGRYGLRPELILFTGDAVFGHREDQPISAQFEQFRTFLDSIRACYDPPIPADHVFIVPGNHDVHRGRVDPGQTRWLDDPSDEHGHSPAEIVSSMVQARGVQWSRYMERLVDYRAFLGLAGYDHLLEDSDRLLFCQQRKIGGARVAICGLNTAWATAGSPR